MPQNPIESGDHEIKKLEEKLTTLKHGDLAILGKIWITGIKTGLLGPNWSIMPTVHAAKPPPPPEKPKRMKYKDLPLYTSPHYEYKDYLEDKDKCEGWRRQMIHEKILPCVTDTRRSWSKSYYELKKDLVEIKTELCTAICKRKCDFIKHMRSPENLQLRQAVLVSGCLTGFYLGTRRFGITRRFVFAGLGLLATGALCFPKETDDAFRNFTYHTTKFLIRIYNFYCNKDFNLREKLPCKDEVPQPLKTNRNPNVCPPKN